MKFIPFSDKIVIDPISQKTVIDTGEEKFLECGVVVSVGSEVNFVKQGDTIFFDAWGCSKTPTFEGKSYYVVSCNSSVILGKYAKSTK